MDNKLLEVVRERLVRDRDNLIAECLVYGIVACGLVVWVIKEAGK